MFVIFTRIDGRPGREGIGCVLLEPGTKGFAVTGTYHTMGGENLHEVVLTVVRDGVAHRFDQGTITVLQRGDRVVVVRAVREQT